MKIHLSIILYVLLAFAVSAQPLFENNVERPMHYHPEGNDFVITNGKEFFNRPLYGTNTAFRVDVGDLPELAFYLPGRGGNLRLGILKNESVKWLHQAEKIVARYRAGSMIYEIEDAALGKGKLHLTILGLAHEEGAMVRIEFDGEQALTLCAAFGGANGDKGARNVDIGCESKPVSAWLQLKPEYCANAEISLTPSHFRCKAKGGVLDGFFSSEAKLFLADAADWNHNILSEKKSSTPIVASQFSVTKNQASYIVIKSLPKNGAAEVVAPNFEKEFEAPEKHRIEITEALSVNTPDAYINAAVTALCVAADGVWDENAGGWMHGAVAWRNPLLGWRGDYIGDALGWQDRQRRFFDSWAKKQNTSKIDASIPLADSKDRLSRNENALHSNGDMSHTHYDMNLVFIDALLRHLLWTGDKTYAEKMWPVIERHLAWERRLFRRDFGGLPLYEAYCCIWASDDLWYSGGGAMHASAYNYYQNQMAARIAKWVGKDAALYEKEAALIAKGIRKHLWLEKEGYFAECKDLLGLQRTHDNPALWTFYHTIDCEFPTQEEGKSMMKYVDEKIAHIPLKGVGVPSDREYFTLPTSNWMPYAWSTNTVVMAEAAHTALAYWQVGRSETAFTLYKGCLLDSMFMGLSPGNVGMTTQFDMARGECQRDFADGVGMVSRALIEGLFGIKPNAIANQISIRPGFPHEWEYASIKHKMIEMKFQRDGLSDTYHFNSHYRQAMKLTFEPAMWREKISSVTINDKETKWETSDDQSRITITADLSEHCEIKINWLGEKKMHEKKTQILTKQKSTAEFDWQKPILQKSQPLNLTKYFNDQVTQLFRHEYLSPRSPYCSLALPKQGYGSWCHPQQVFDIDDTGLRLEAMKNNGFITLPNKISLFTPGEQQAKNIAFVSQWDNYPKEISIPVSGKATQLFLLMAGTTNSNQSQFDNGEVIVTYTDETTSRLPLHNPTTWWPIDQDYVIDDYAFRFDGALPLRVDLKTGVVRNVISSKKSRSRNLMIPGGAATVLPMSLDGQKEMKSITIRAIANEVVIGLMSATFVE